MLKTGKQQVRKVKKARKLFMSSLTNTINESANLKRKTKLEAKVLSQVNDESKELLNKMLEEGVPGNIVRDLILCGIQKKLSKDAIEREEKFKKMIEDGNFHEVVHAFGRGKYMYAKFVQVDGYQSIVDEKKFNSERACRQWLKMKKIRGLI